MAFGGFESLFAGRASAGGDDALPPEKDAATLLLSCFRLWFRVHRIVFCGHRRAQRVLLPESHADQKDVDCREADTLAILQGCKVELARVGVMIR
jgi:hypothetical protein